MTGNDLYGFDLERMLEGASVHNLRDREEVVMMDRYC